MPLRISLSLLVLPSEFRTFGYHVPGTQIRISRHIEQHRFQHTVVDFLLFVQHTFFRIRLFYAADEVVESVRLVVSTTSQTIETGESVMMGMALPASA